MKKLLCILLVAPGTTNHAFSQNQQVSYREAEEVATNWIQIHCPEYLSKKKLDDYITLDVSGLHPGTYLLTVTTPSGSRTARFIRK